MYQSLPVDHGTSSMGLLFNHLLTKAAPVTTHRPPCNIKGILLGGRGERKREREKERERCNLTITTQAC